MKKILLMLLVLTTISGKSDAQSESVSPYFSTGEMPKLPFLSPPDSTSVRFLYDLHQYYLGRELRQDSLRAAIAIRDAVYGLQTIINEFSEPFGLQISKEKTPAIYNLLKDGLATCDSICTLPKREWMRRRPFKTLHGSSLTPWDEEALSANGSWPSGHSILGWSAALLLSEINPDRADTLLARGYLYGTNRIVCQVHWQSDVDDARIFAAVAYSKLHTSKRFLEQMRRARMEFKRLSRPLSSQAISDLEELEQQLGVTVYNMPHEVDEVSGLKLIFVKTDECDCEIARAVDNVILVDKDNKVVWVVKTLVRHDNDAGRFYGILVTNGAKIGEIQISEGDAIELQDFLFARDPTPLVNCTTIRFMVSTSSNLSPVSTSEQKMPPFFDRIDSE